jgi:hypothetical protein
LDIDQRDLLVNKLNVDVDQRKKDSMLESSSVSIGLKCAWNGLSKQETKCDQSIYEEQSILLSGPYGDDVAFIKQFNDQIIIGKIIFYLNKDLF